METLRGNLLTPLCLSKLSSFPHKKGGFGGLAVHPLNFFADWGGGLAGQAERTLRPQHPRPSPDYWTGHPPSPTASSDFAEGEGARTMTGTCKWCTSVANLTTMGTLVPRKV